MKRGRKDLKIVGIALASLVCGFVLTAAIPVRAYASDGFLGGLEDLVGVRESETVEDYESDYLADYDPQLRADPPDPGTNSLTELDEDSTTVDFVRVTVDNYNRVQWAQTFVSYPIAISRVLTAGQLGPIVLVAASFVFMWWGVRKSLNVIMNAFRNGGMKV